MISPLDLGCVCYKIDALPMLTLAEAGGHSPSLTEAGEGHHLPGHWDFDHTCFIAGVDSLHTKQTKNIQFINITQF